MQILKYALIALAVPMPPKTVTIKAATTLTIIESNPVVYNDPANNEDQPGRVLLEGKAVYTFKDFGEVPWDSVLEVFPPDVEDPATIDPNPEGNVDPGFDEHSPTGPGEGPPGANPVDKPEI